MLFFGLRCSFVHLTRWSDKLILNIISKMALHFVEFVEMITEEFLLSKKVQLVETVCLSTHIVNFEEFFLKRVKQSQKKNQFMM